MRFAKVDAAHQAELIESGGISKKTKDKRDFFVKNLESFLKANCKQSIAGMISNLEKEDGIKKMESHLISFFQTIRVRDNKLPKRGYLESIKSNLKCHILGLSGGKVDISQPAIFPGLHQFLKGHQKELKSAGRADTEHYQEIADEDLMKIFDLCQNVVTALERRGEDDYQEKLMKIPSEFRNCYHKLLQYAAQIIVMLMDCRRGREGLEDLKKSTYCKEYDPTSDTSFFVKTCGEKSKNHQTDSENLKQAGIIHFSQSAHGFNPGKTYEFYLNSLHEDNVYLFQRPRRPSKEFDLHDPSTITLFEPKAKLGVNTLAQTMPQLCTILGLPRMTNHSLRATSITRMKRFGLEDRAIMRVSGHKRIETLTNYNPNPTVAEKLMVASAITGTHDTRGDANGGEFIDIDVIGDDLETVSEVQQHVEGRGHSELFKMPSQIAQLSKDSVMTSRADRLMQIQMAQNMLFLEQNRTLNRFLDEEKK